MQATRGMVSEELSPCPRADDTIFKGIRNCDSQSRVAGEDQKMSHASVRKTIPAHSPRQKPYPGYAINTNFSAESYFYQYGSEHLLWKRRALPLELHFYLVQSTNQGRGVKDFWAVILALPFPVLDADTSHTTGVAIVILYAWSSMGEVTWERFKTTPRPQLYYANVNNSNYWIMVDYSNYTLHTNTCDNGCLSRTRLHTKTNEPIEKETAKHRNTQRSIVRK